MKFSRSFFRSLSTRDGFLTLRNDDLTALTPWTRMSARIFTSFGPFKAGSKVPLFVPSPCVYASHACKQYPQVAFRGSFILSFDVISPVASSLYTYPSLRYSYFTGFLLCSLLFSALLFCHTCARSAMDRKNQQPTEQYGVFQALRQASLRGHSQAWLLITLARLLLHTTRLLFYTKMGQSEAA